MPKKLPKRTKDLPATHGMLFEVRDELKASINGLRKEMDANINGLRKEMDANINGLRKEMEVGFFSMKELFHQSMLRFEEQRSENRVVLEAVHGLAQRQDRLETEFVEIRETVRTLAKGKASKGGRA